ncbi:uncharacterized protein LOC116805734 [Drosophila grimshawi]|uniref:uncharacterized protein LOC116805734 n=1 Tax=Drosophila grimshawi TaxID=7222 RepID=UPI000C86FE4D|nr:uncharacterized protein LOC116805734 [Drosophila grimshawi]
MGKSVLLGLVLVALIGIQLVNSLTCYSCKSEASCRNPSFQVCSNATVSANMAFLKTVYTDVPTLIDNSQYKCANLSSSFSSNMTAEFQGCIDKFFNICFMASNTPPFNINMTCDMCNWSYCNTAGLPPPPNSNIPASLSPPLNKNNPAGAHSQSTYTIIATAIALIIFKAILSEIL